MRTSDGVIYLDHQATTPLDPRVLEAMLPYMTSEFANPASSHRLGRQTASALNTARHNIRVALGAHYDSEIVFTSGATEANHLAIIGSVTADKKSNLDHVVTTAIEHQSVMASCTLLAENGYSSTVVGVDSDGVVDPTRIASAITSRTKLVSVMYANNEVGTIEPIPDIGAITQERQVLLHVDAVQAIGAVNINLAELGADLVSFSAHKIYGPKGIGLLYVRRGTQIRPQYAESQESGMRAGTSNVAAAIGLAKALDILLSERVTENNRATALRDKLSAHLLAEIPECYINGNTASRLPGNLSVTIAGIDAEMLIEANPDLAISTGSACTSGHHDPSHVLMAMGKSRPDARSTLRISLGRTTQPADIEDAANRIIASVRRFRMR